MGHLGERLRRHYPEPYQIVDDAINQNPIILGKLQAAVQVAKAGQLALLREDRARCYQYVGLYLLEATGLAFLNSDVREFYDRPDQLGKKLCQYVHKAAFPDEPIPADLEWVTVRQLWSGQKTTLNATGGSLSIIDPDPGELPRFKQYADVYYHAFRGGPLPHGGRPKGTRGSGKFKDAADARQKILAVLEDHARDEIPMEQADIAPYWSLSRRGLEHWLSQIKDQFGETWGDLKREAESRANDDG